MSLENRVAPPVDAELGLRVSHGKLGGSPGSHENVTACPGSRPVLQAKLRLGVPGLVISLLCQFLCPAEG